MIHLIGDIGGTNTRLALVAEGTAWRRLRTHANAEFASLEAVIDHYLQDVRVSPRGAAFAVAGPVKSGEVRLTNRGWMVSAAKLSRRFNLDDCLVVNDFSAVALGIFALTPKDVEQVGGDVPEPGAPIAILGPGTGLGVGGLIPSGQGRGGRILVTEGGHASLAAIDARSEEVIARLRVRLGHVSAERAISGQGIEHLYQALAEIEGRRVERLGAADIGALSDPGGDPIAAQAMALFFRLLGSFAGDLALSYGAFGGVYVAGGIVPRYLPRLRKSGFRRAFETKGRMSDYLRGIPAYVVLHPEVELLGLAASLDARGSGRPWPAV